MINLDQGTLYRVDPVSGQTVAEDVVGWEGGDMTVTTPPYALDVALRMRLVP